MKEIKESLVHFPSSLALIHFSYKVSFQNFKCFYIQYSSKSLTIVIISLKKF